MRVIDFMPVRDTQPDLVRIVEGSRHRRDAPATIGSITAQSSLAQRLDNQTLNALGGPDGLILRTPVDLEPDGMTTADFVVRAGERVVRPRGTIAPGLPQVVDPEQALEAGRTGNGSQPADTRQYPAAVIVR